LGVGVGVDSVPGHMMPCVGQLTAHSFLHVSERYIFYSSSTLYIYTLPIMIISRPLRTLSATSQNRAQDPSYCQLLAL
jgi:hypothetical protein